MKKRTVMALVFFFLLSNSVWGAKTSSVGRSFLVMVDSLPVFASSDLKPGMKPLFFIKRSDGVVCVEEKGELFKVQTVGAQFGWVEKNSLARDNSQALFLEELKVLGYLDNPDPVYILDMANDTDWKPIRVDRSFVLDPGMGRNLSKENFEWENEIYYYKGVIFKPEAVNPKKGRP